MDIITQANATAANLFTNLTPTNTIVPKKTKKQKKRETNGRDRNIK